MIPCALYHGCCPVINGPNWQVCTFNSQQDGVSLVIKACRCIQALQSSPAQVLRQQQDPRRRREEPKPQDRFGLMGLLGVIRMQDPDLTTLALGCDLTTLGLPLNSSELVYKAFANPWAEQPIRQEPSFQVHSFIFKAIVWPCLCRQAKSFKLPENCRI